MRAPIKNMRIRVDAKGSAQDKSSYTQLKSATIMLVDDEPIMLDIVQALLEGEGYENFIREEKSTQAITRLVEARPDIVLLDLDMPDVDGFEILASIREIEEYRFLPVIILTASEEAGSKLKALELGATDFLSKPVDASELALRVRNTLSAKAYQDYLTNYDSLTGLPNRALYIKKLDAEIESSKESNNKIILLDVDIENFRHINKTLGHFTGDTLLQMVAQRLQYVVRGSDVVGVGRRYSQIENIAHMGGNEFSIILCGVNNVDSVSAICNRILEVLTKQYVIDDKELHLGANIGIAVYPDDGNSSESLIKNASSAKDFSRKEVKNSFQFYSSSMNEHASEKLKLESDLRRAVDKSDFELYYQPKIDVKSGAVMGVECLLRWYHPDKGYVSPEYFVPIAEKMGLIIPVGDWVLHEACMQASRWVEGIGVQLKISVNVSAMQFMDDGLKDSIVSALQTSGLKPENLILEITESMLMGDVEKNAKILNEIKELGVSFSLDDFGTGYSSLSYLKKLPIDELKIDRSFLIDVPEAGDDSAIVKAIIAMAHSLGQIVVAEGVERKEQLEFLQLLDCDIIQGYYYSKPLSNADFIKFVGESSPKLKAQC